VSAVTADKVRQFLLSRYSKEIEGTGLALSDVPDSFDFLSNGIIDSFGILEMISLIEMQFEIRLDMAALDAEQITVLGALSEYVAGYARGID
jgi:acyl carrier protein